MKKLNLKKCNVTKLNNLVTINGGGNGEETGNETFGTRGTIKTIIKDDPKQNTVLDTPGNEK